MRPKVQFCIECDQEVLPEIDDSELGPIYPDVYPNCQRDDWSYDLPSDREDFHSDV